MTRTAAIWLVLVLALGIGSYPMKYEVQRAEHRLEAINRDILRDQETIHALRAEWSYLNQPARLERLAMGLLSLETARADQVKSIDQLPLRADESPPLEVAPALPPLAEPRRPTLASARTTQ